jgi:hypothetical protein
MVKSAALLLVAMLAVTSLITVEFACAQVGVTTPATPNFGVKYDIFITHVPPTYGVDPSTGKAVAIQEGYDGVDETVYLYIVNQPFVPYKDSDGNYIQLFYSVRWLEPSNNSWVDPVRTTQAPNQEFTVCTFKFMGKYHKVSYGLDIPIGSETDFQVEASIGYFTADNVFIGKTSGWTNPQSIQHAPDYDASNSSPVPSSPSATSTPSDSLTERQQEVEVIIGVAIVAVVLGAALGLLIYLIKRR